MKETTLGVALVKEQCPICAAEIDGPIVMNTVLTRGRARAVEEMHGKVIGVADHPCDECKKLIKMGILLVQVDEAMTKDRKNPWRTGKQCVIKEEAAKRMFKDVDLSKRVAFVPIEIWEQIKLP